MARKINTKYCPACKTEHPVEAFGNDKTAKDGKYRICFVADREQQKAWRAKRAAKVAAEHEAAEAKKVARRRTRTKVAAK